MVYYVINKGENYNADAGYNRVRLFQKGLSEIGVQCSIIGLKYNKIPTISHRLFTFFKRRFVLLRLFFKVSRKDVIIIYGETKFTFFYKYISKRTNLIVELNEYPLVERLIHPTKESHVLWKNNSFALKYANTIITCSTFLKKRYEEFCHNIYISPLIVDMKEFAVKQEKTTDVLKQQYIAYCGSLNNNKDGVPILIQAFKKFHNVFPNIKLVIIGGGDKESIDELLYICDKLEITDNVFFTGSIPHSQIASWLNNAIMLVLSRPNNKQAEGGVPSKLGEYLASGVPCVVTDVGDLHLYLEDEKNCYLAYPDSVNSFAEKMIKCYSNPNTQIIINAMNTVKQFDYIKQSKLLKDYLEHHFGKEVIK